MLNDDISMAQQIVSNKLSNINFSVPYHKHSFIYKTTNEKTNYYQYLLEDINFLLCVISSGDQVLNAIAAGVSNIDCYDISVFPKYFLELKVAAIKSLEKSEFIDYFFRLKDYSEFSEDIYDKIRCNLTPNVLKFWDSLYNFYDGYEIYNSTLFSSEPYNVDEIIKNMPYLLYYEDVKNNIGKVNLNYYEGNVYDIVNNSNKHYDLINLSSIIYYEKEMLKDFKKFLLSCQNISNKVLVYLYKVTEQSLSMFHDYFQEENFTIDTCQNDALLICQKIKNK